MAVKCEICGINNAQTTDYRNNDGIYSKYVVCPQCFLLNDRWFFKLKYAKEGISKKKVMAQIIEGTWKDYLTNDNQLNRIKS